MAWRSAGSTLEKPFNKGETVVSTEDLPGVPARTSGKVKLVNGFTWRRYWVFFENGVKVGSLDSGQLVRPADWQYYQTAKAEREAAATAVAETARQDVIAADPSSEASGGDDDSPAARLRALVPPHLLERSAAARARLGG